MTPLKQWICDTCGELIKKPEEGWFEWLEDHNGAHSFKIVHHATSSPKQRGCYQYDNNPDVCDGHLDSYVGSEKLPFLYQFLDTGPIVGSKTRVQQSNIPAFTEILRRLTLPYYEEARIYWSKAKSDGEFDEANEVSPYLKLQDFVDRWRLA